MSEALDAVNVWIVEDNTFLRDTLRELIGAHPEFRCGLAAGSCEAALHAIRRGGAPDVVLMDLGLPGMSGIDGIAQLAVMSPVSRVVVLSVHEDDDQVFQALCTGAVGYLLKPASDQQIVNAVDTAMRGGAPINAFIARRMLSMFTRTARPRTDHGLTPREMEILQLLVEARSQKQIAGLLTLSPHTVDTHVRNIYAKLHVRSRGGAVAKAISDRII